MCPNPKPPQPSSLPDFEQQARDLGGADVLEPCHVAETPLDPVHEFHTLGETTDEKVWGLGQGLGRIGG